MTILGELALLDIRYIRLIETVLAGLTWQICLIYLDNIIVHGELFEAILTNLDSVFSTLQEEVLLKFKPRTRQIFKRQVECFDHIVSEIKKDPKKIQAVRHWPESNNAI